MPVETELKLSIAPEYLNKLKRHPLLKTLATTRATTRKLHSIYYDTPKLELRSWEMALRLRRTGGRWLQTLKGGGKAEAGLHQRNEWETPVAGEALDLDALETIGVQLPQRVRRKLQPIFATDFSRNTRLLSFDGAEIELSMDSGEIRAARRARAISELELELKSGEPVQLFRLALALHDIVPMEVEQISKAEYGYRLFANAKPVATKAGMLDLAKCPDVPCALQAMIWSCLSHLQANVPGAVHRLHEEYLHQVRVALRRLRVVLGMAETFRTDGELAALRTDVAALCVELGRSREWDVFTTQILAPMRARLLGRAGLRSMLSASAKLREQHYAKVRDALQSHNFQRLLLRFGIWMLSDYWNEPAVGDGLTLRQFSARILQRYSKQVKKRGKQLASADASRLHALRIACKKLRYSAELLASLYSGAKVKRYLSALEFLQNALGMLNDIVVAHQLLDELDNTARHEIITLIHDRIEHGFADCMAGLHKAMEKVSRQDVFWKLPP